VESGTLFQIATVVLVLLLLVRIGLEMPSWLRRRRQPEARTIRVVGVGGGGSNAVDRMVAARIPGVELVAINTDAQALRRSAAPTKIRIGDTITHGLGSGGDPTVGQRAAEEDADKIRKALTGSDLVFVTAGLGGGTGSGAAPVIAAVAKDIGALVIAVVTKPFTFEGYPRRIIADAATHELTSNVDAFISIPNDRVADVVAEDASLGEAFRTVDDVLHRAITGIVDLIRVPGVVNLDFADIRAVMQNAGPALMSVGRASGADRAKTAASQAIRGPLLETGIEGAQGILFNVAGPADLRLSEVMQAANEIRASASPHANVIFGTSVDAALGDDVQITLIATGLTGSATPVPVAQTVPTATEPPVAEPSVRGSRRRPSPVTSTDRETAHG